MHHDTKLRTLLLASLGFAFMLASTGCGSSRKTVVQTYDSSNQVSSEPTSVKPTIDISKAGPEAVPALAEALVAEARDWLGTPYRYGGHDRDGSDCSGFVMEVFRRTTGIAIPRNSAAQKEYCAELGKTDLAVGDLVFFSSNASGDGIAHVGLYVGNDMMIHASSSRGVIESSLNQKYYLDHFRGAGRVPAIAQLLPVPKQPEVEPTRFAENDDVLLAETEMPVARQPEPISIPEPVSLTIAVNHEEPAVDEPQNDTPHPSPVSVVRGAFANAASRQSAKTGL